MPSIAPDAPALSFLAERFSFSDMPGFLALGFFGDLSANAIVPCDRTQVHRSGGAGVGPVLVGSRYQGPQRKRAAGGCRRLAV